MDVKKIVRAIERKRPQLALLGLSLLFLVAVALVVGALGRILPYLLVGVVLIIIALYVFHARLIRRGLRPMISLLDRPADAAPPSDAEVEQGLSIVDGFPARNAAWTIGLWLLGLAVLVIGVELWVGMTRWQMFAVSVLGIAGAILDGLLGYHSDLRSLGPVRIVLESIRPIGSRQQKVQGNLARSLLVSFAVVMVLFLVLFSLVWYGRARENSASHILAEESDAVASIGRRAQRELATNPTVTPEKMLLAAAGNHDLLSELAILGPDGAILAGRAQADPVWLRRLVEADAVSWLDVRAPFLYQRLNIDDQRSLIWIGPLRRLDDAIEGVIWTSFLGGVLLLGMCLVLAWSMVWSGLRPLRSLSERVRRLGQGDFSQSVEVSGGGELAALALALEDVIRMVKSMAVVGERAGVGLIEHHSRLVNRLESLKHGADHNSEIAERTAASVVQMRSSIQSISEQVESLREAASDCSSTLFEIEQSVREVSASSDNLQQQVDETAGGIKNVTAAMTTIFNNVETLHVRAEEANSTITAMTSAIKQVEDNATETNRLSSEVSEIASRGADSVRETITGINEIEEVTDEAAEVINRLGTQMEAVGKILTVISDVARQTNLLALNAAIIAAAAGEHGKGFAVVADEIKDLADRTATSTKEIAGLIKSVQADSRRAVDAIERGAGSVKRGVKLAFNAGEALQQILNAVDQVDSMADEISRSSADHARLADSVSRYIKEMSKMLHDIRRATGEQSEEGARVARVSTRLLDDARFVRRSAQEQVQAISGVSQNMERIAEMVGFVGKAISEQEQGVGHVARSAEDVRDASLQSSAQLADVEEIASRIGRVAREVQAELKAGNGPVQP